MNKKIIIDTRQYSIYNPTIQKFWSFDTRKFDKKTPQDFYSLAHAKEEINDSQLKNAVVVKVNYQIEVL